MQEEEENRSKERTRPSKNKFEIMIRSRNKLQNRPVKHSEETSLEKAVKIGGVGKWRIKK